MRTRSTPPPPIRADRCACCYEWPRKFGGIGTFIPFKGGEPVHYTLCPRCTNRLQRNPGDQAILKRIEAYITDQRVQPV